MCSYLLIKQVVGCVLTYLLTHLLFDVHISVNIYVYLCVCRLMHKQETYILYIFTWKWLKVCDTCRKASSWSSMPFFGPHFSTWLILLQGWRKKAGIQNGCHPLERNVELSGILCRQCFELCLLKGTFEVGWSRLLLEEARITTSRREHDPHWCVPLCRRLKVMDKT